jgi:hypothetical protein
VTEPAVFFIELAAFFEAADHAVDDALARHFGFATAADWVIAHLELLACNRPQPPLPLTPIRPTTSTGAHT